MPIDPKLLPRPRPDFEFVPVGEIIEMPEKNLKIYHVGRDQIEAFERYYGVRPCVCSQLGITARRGQRRAGIAGRPKKSIFY